MPGLTRKDFPGTKAVHVMRGLVPRIHVFGSIAKTWMAGTSPAMTACDSNVPRQALAICRAAGDGRGPLQLETRIEPAVMHPTVEGVGRFWVKRSLADHAAEARLNMSGRAPKAIVKIEMAERGIEVIPPHQPHDAAAEPDAFGITRRAVDGLGGFCELVGAALILACVLRGIGRRVCGRLALLLGTRAAALGKRATDTEQDDDERGDGNMPQDRIR